MCIVERAFALGLDAEMVVEVKAPEEPEPPPEEKPEDREEESPPSGLRLAAKRFRRRASSWKDKRKKYD